MYLCDRMSDRTEMDVMLVSASTCPQLRHVLCGAATVRACVALSAAKMERQRNGSKCEPSKNGSVDVRSKEIRTKRDGSLVGETESVQKINGICKVSSDGADKMIYTKRRETVNKM